MLPAADLSRWLRRRALFALLLSAVFATGFTDRFTVFANLQRPPSLVVSRMDPEDNTTKIHYGSVKDVCEGVLRPPTGMESHGKPWLVLLGTPQQSLAEALSCYDPSRDDSCMRNVQHIIAAHHAEHGGDNVLSRVMDKFDSIIEIDARMDAHGGICEVKGEAFVPFLRLRMRTPPSTSKMDMHLRREAAIRRSEEMRKKILQQRGAFIPDDVSDEM